MMSPRRALSSVRSNRAAHKSRQSAMSSSESPELPVANNDCTSAFYSHPPTTISLEQLKPPEKAKVVMRASSESALGSAMTDSSKRGSALSEPPHGKDLEGQKKSARRKSLGCWQEWSCKQILILKLLMGVLVMGIAITIGVTLSIVVGNGKIVTTVVRKGNM